MNTAAYLARIGIDAPPRDTTAQTLAALQAAHLTHVPYENLDILLGVPLSLDDDALFDKIVTRCRGGYCFELGGLFAVLLRELGFPVTEYFGRFHRDAGPGIPMRRHRILRVTTSDAGDFICDVGVGGVCPLLPLPFGPHTAEVPTEAVRERDRAWRIRADAFWGHMVEEYRHGAWAPYYSFTEEPQVTVDYMTTSFWCETSPDSPFRAAPIVCVQTPTGRKTIRDGEYHEFDGESVLTEPVGDLTALLAAKFGIVLPADSPLAIRP